MFLGTFFRKISKDNLLKTPCLKSLKTIQSNLFFLIGLIILLAMSSLTGLLSILSIFNNLYSFDIMVFLFVVGLWLSISALSLIPA